MLEMLFLVGCTLRFVLINCANYSLPAFRMSSYRIRSSILAPYHFSQMDPNSREEKD